MKTETIITLTGEEANEILADNLQRKVYFKWGELASEDLNGEAQGDGMDCYDLLAKWFLEYISGTYPDKIATVGGQEIIQGVKLGMTTQSTAPEMHSYIEVYEVIASFTVE